MAKIDDLLQELCPDGVELVKFTDYVNVQYGFAFDAKKFTEDPVFLPLIRIRDIVSGTTSTYYSGKYSPEYIVEPGDILVGMDGNFNLGVWKDSAGLLNQRVCKLFSKDESILLNGFIKYYMKPIFTKIEQQTSAGSVKHLSAKTINGIKMHLPPIPIQQQIVEALDTFTDAISNLEEELALREKQFEYYREQLLSFDKHVECKELKAVAKIKNGKDYKHLSCGNIPVFGSGGIMCYVDQYVYDKPTVLIPRKGSLGNLFYVDVPFWNVDTIFYTEINTDLIKPKYLYYYLAIQRLDKLNGAGGVPSLTQTILNRIPIPLPPLNRQQEIVEILDTFEAMIANINEEIVLRTKQYEYYREKLLSFGK